MTRLDTPHAPRPREGPGPLALLPPLAVGAGLRLLNLGGQVLGGDELHAVRAAVAMPLPEVLTTYLDNDNSIPLTALYRLAMDSGLGLSELAIRLPMLVAGLAALALLPVLLGRRAGPAVAIHLAWLVALSPALVLYSRMARSYMPMVLAATGAALAFEAWWRTRSRRAAVTYVALAALAAWLHLGAAPFVAAPFLFALGDLLRERLRGGPGEAWRSGWRGLCALLGLGAAVALACALFLLPARESLARLVASKQGQSSIVPRAVLSVLELQAGTPRPVLAALFWLAAVAGALLLLRSRPRFGAYALTLAAGHLAGMLILSPRGIDHPLVLNRYLLPVLPLLLLWVAVALVHPWTGGRAGRLAQRGLAVVFVAALLVTGPFGDPRFRASSFTHHNDFFNFTAPRGTLPAEAIPGFYRRLAAPGSPAGVLLEAPWPSTWSFNRSFYVHQAVHGREVLVATVLDEPLEDPRLALANHVRAAPEAFLASRARWLVVHLNVAREESRVTHPENLPRRMMRPLLRQDFRVAGNRLARRLTRLWGAPDYADAAIRVWDLDRVRATKAPLPS